MTYDAIILGGGAAGLFCAIEAGKRGRKTLVIEHNAEVGRKILISGGGRCNFTNLHTSPDNFISRNPHFCKSALSRYAPRDFVRLVEKHGIEFYEKKLGQLFCSGSSRQIVAMLVDECAHAGVEIRTQCAGAKVGMDEYFNVETSQGVFTGRKLVVAAGGLSFRKVGASDLGYTIARRFGLKIEETRPSLVALTFSGQNEFGKLAGISIDSVVSVSNRSFRENILFTHRGLSGPAILQASNYWNWGTPMSINLLPDTDIAELLRHGRSSGQRLETFLAARLPERFVSAFAGDLGRKRMDQLSNSDIAATAEKFGDWTVDFAGTEGYDRAEVTRGGISTAELSSKTMEAKKVPGLYFIGEVVDVTGWLGGYNFQWAWSSAYAAGQAI